MGVVNPAPGFLETLRALTHASGALLIFDEVITGFRLTWGGYQALCGIAPAITCLGKIIGGGLPVGAFGGRADLMARHEVGPAAEGPDGQASTDDFPEAGDGWRDAAQRLIAAPGQAEAGDHLVEDEQGARGVRERAQGLEKSRRRVDDAHVGRHGLLGQIGRASCRERVSRCV